MDFLKKHYEKILLGLVLAGLVGALVFMPFYISASNADTTALITSLTTKPVTQLPDLDLSAQSAVVARLSAPANLDLETTNRLFNPLEWQRTLDNTLVPAASHIGPQVVVVTNITPLYLILSLDSVSTNDAAGDRYVIGVEKQGERVAARRHKVQHYVMVGDKPTDVFSDLQIKGPPENPDSVSVKLVDTGDIVTFSPDHPYRRVEAYMADFRYDPERKSYHNRRVGDHVSFNGTDYIVDDVSADELVLQDQSNLKKTTRPLTP